MEERKQKEIQYYDQKAKAQLEISEDQKGDFEGFDPFLLSSYNSLKEYLKDKCQGKAILDYGCGNGVHAWWLAKYGGNVTAIDLSEKSLEIAKKKAEKEGVLQKIKFIKMDCEELDFPDKFFDIIFDGGTFSSLDLDKAFLELKRVLKPGGFLIGIETFGHNPLTNLKRKLNKLSGKRTEWAASHIFKESDFKKAKNYFGKIEVKYFHLVSWAVFPFLKLPSSRSVLKILEFIDRVLLVLPFLKKYSFKVVFVFRI